MPTIEYVYSAYSAFAYLGSKRLTEICDEFGARLVHRPVLLSPVVEAQGSLPFAARTQAHVDYFFGREIERWAELRAVPILSYRPTHHDADYAVATGLILALGQEGPAVNEMAHRLLEAHWRDDADLSDVDTLARIASDAGHDAKALLRIAQSEDIRAEIRANIDWAVTLNVFGSPTYIVDGDPFYGQDRLDLVERALTRPFAPTTWRNPPVG